MDAVDSFCKEVNLDGLLHVMAIRLIACGNDFWLQPVGFMMEEISRKFLTCE
jgi:hypothetical protein